MTIFDFILSQVTILLLIQVSSFLFLSVLLSHSIKTRKQRLNAFNELSELRQDIRTLTSAALGIGERVLKLERQQRLGISSINTVAELAHNNETHYEQAINLVQKGADTDDLVDAYGLSQGEADLVSLLHRINDVAEKNSAAISA